ncbi:sensor histidine kinase [Zongyangia hominis]|uniref:histidine kinase n=1 Tax=Zongyangia hominis TaxID=2763677 RepID=A0A926EAE9_9FIRM|nr:HAMP domain-containing sensor histidine kinase [Zongyangia hominis]MBC8570890.1 HAMP domain-containing histidine kinase [Zongyangia hominis]
MAVKKITKRWLFNSMAVILVILLAIEIVFAVGIKGYYYNGVEQILRTRAAAMGNLLQTYAQDSATDFATEVRSYVENYADKERIELMAINAAGDIALTSSGFEPNNLYYMPDYEQALGSSNAIGQFQGTVEGENVMAVTVMSPVSNQEFTAMRFVVSLEQVDQQIVMLICLVTAIAAAIIFFVVLSSSYFINSIVIPVGEVGQAARKIAHGDFAYRLHKKNDDEIGELVDVINYMAGELSAAETMKNDFISSVSHELRTPLTAIKGWGETLLAESKDENVDPQTIQKGMGVILKETDRLSGMVEELLDFSRMQSGRLKLNMNRLDLVAELSDAVLMFTERAKREGVELSYEEPEEFWVIYGDKNRLRQVFVNIVDNALKYSDNGDKITIAATEFEQYVHISVQDTGCGISAEDLPKIKQKFYKGNSTRRGSGIGLAVADEIVSMHGGSLGITSREGEGTCVTISLPLMTKKVQAAIDKMGEENAKS